MPRNKSFNQKEVLDKATELFWEKGYNATSIQDLVDHLELNRSSIYNSFGDKYELFIKALESYKDEGYENFAKKLSGDAPARELIHNLFKKVGSECACDSNRGCLMVNSATELSNSDAQVEELFTSNRKRMQAKLQEVLDRGIESDELRNDMDSEATASYLYNAYIGLTALGTTNMESGEIENIINVTLSVLD